MSNNSFQPQRTDKEMILGTAATVVVIAFYVWFMFALDRKSQKNNEIVQQKLISIQQELKENKDMDIYTRVKLHGEENTLIYYDSKSPEYRKLKRQILREFRQNKKVAKTR